MKTVAAVVLLAASVAGGTDTVWTGTQTVDRVIRFEHGENLVIKPGTRVAFVGPGRIAARDTDIRIEGAEIAADSVLTNAYRIQVENGRLDVANCRVTGLRSHEPVKGVGYHFGSMSSQNGSGARFTGNTLVDCSPVCYVNGDGMEVSRNVFIRPRQGGAYLFNVTNCRVVDNQFFDAPAEALQLNGTHLGEIVGNRFTDCGLGIRACGMKNCRVVGNSWFGGRDGIALWWDGNKNLFSANLFEDLRGCAVYAHESIGRGDVFANNHVARCGNGFFLPKLKPENGVVVRDSVFFSVGIAVALAGGNLSAPNNAVSKSKFGFLPRKGTDAVIDAPGLVSSDPKFRDAAAGDWRLAEDSPLRGAGTNGGNIGVYQ